MMRNAPVDVVAVPDTVPPPVFWTVNVRSAELPTFTVPKFTVPVGLTAKSPRATADCAGARQALCAPVESTAVTETKYDVPVVSPVSLRLTVWFDAGLAVGDAT
jgi:hypothetical protein